MSFLLDTNILSAYLRRPAGRRPEYWSKQCANPTSSGSVRGPTPGDRADGEIKGAPRQDFHHQMRSEKPGRAIRLRSTCPSSSDGRENSCARKVFYCRCGLGLRRAHSTHLEKPCEDGLDGFRKV